jgi:hypothetical protein
MHPEFAFQIASFRRDELTSAATRHAVAGRRRGPFWRRRRDTPPPLTLVGPPPPQLGRDPTGRAA